MNIGSLHWVFFSGFLDKRIPLALILMMIASCGLIPRMPIQMSRITQIEHYEQVFITNRQGGAALAPDGTCNNATSIYLDDVFLRMLGPENWRNLSAVYGLSEMCTELMTGSISITGTMNFMIYLLAGDQERFQIDGFGHYFLVQKSDKDKILMAGDFRVQPAVYSIGDMRRGYLDIDIQLITTKVVLADTYLHKTDLRYRIFIDTSRADKDTYAIDYSRKHEAYIGDDLFGEIRIADNGQNAKLFDLRGRALLQSDYESVTNP